MSKNNHAKTISDLDRRKILPPLYFVISDSAYNEVKHSREYTKGKLESFTDLQSRLISERLDEVCMDTVHHFCKELSTASNPNLWNAFVKNNGLLSIDYDDLAAGLNEGEGYYGNVSQIDGRFDVQPTIKYSNRKYNDSLIHELAHWLDDKSAFSIKRSPSGTVNLEHECGLHSQNPIWGKIKQADKVFGEKESLQILNNISAVHHEIVGDNFDHEFFAHAIARHLGPQKKAQTKSPALAAYMETVVALDIRIMNQDKSLEERYADREKLYNALKQPLDRYVDLKKVNEAIANYNTSSPPAQKVGEELVETTLRKGLTEVSKSIGLPSLSPAKKEGPGR